MPDLNTGDGQECHDCRDGEELKHGIKIYKRTKHMGKPRLYLFVPSDKARENLIQCRTVDRR